MRMPIRTADKGKPNKPSKTEKFFKLAKKAGEEAPHIVVASVLAYLIFSKFIDSCSENMSILNARWMDGNMSTAEFCFRAANEFMHGTAPYLKICIVSTALRKISDGFFHKAK